MKQEQQNKKITLEKQENDKVEEDTERRQPLSLAQWPTNFWSVERLKSVSIHFLTDVEQSQKQTHLYWRLACQLVG